MSSKSPDMQEAAFSLCLVEETVTVTLYQGATMRGMLGGTGRGNREEWAQHPKEL